MIKEKLYDSNKHHHISLSKYKEFVQKALMKNYHFIYYNELGINEREIILRHDVDKDLGCALSFAKFEKEIGVKSTYFVMIRNPLYNVMARKNVEILNEIIELGHHIALHFDCNFYKMDSKQEILHFIEKEARILSWIIGKDIQFISFHQPSRELLDEDYAINSIQSVYNKKYYKDIRYIADSLARWHDSSILELIENKNSPAKIQFLSHPFWWIEREQKFKNIFNKLLELKIVELKKDLAEMSNDPKKGIIVYGFKK